jgi:hypothetical protein
MFFLFCIHSFASLREFFCLHFSELYVIHSVKCDCNCYLHMQCTLRCNFSSFCTFFGFHPSSLGNIQKTFLKIFFVYTLLPPPVCILLLFVCIFPTSVCILPQSLCILTTAPQLSISQKVLGTLPEDGSVMPKHVGATIHN